MKVASSNKVIRLTELACIFRLGGCLPSLLATLFRTHRSVADSENFEFRAHAPFTCEVVEARDQPIKSRVVGALFLSRMGPSHLRQESYDRQAPP
jgi:hypothetical protein